MVFPRGTAAPGDPVVVGAGKWFMVPQKVTNALLAGKFNGMLHGQSPNSIKVQQGLREIFGRSLAYMLDSNTTLRAAINHLMKPDEAKSFIQLINSVYDGACPFLDCDAQIYVSLAGLKVDIGNWAANKKHATTVTYHPEVRLQKGRQYYWRVRLRNEYDVMSSWSAVTPVII